MKGNPNIHKVAVPFTTETAKAAQQKGVEARKENKARNDFEVALAQKIMNGQTLTAEEKQKLEAYGIPDGAQWQAGMIAVLEEAKKGNYKAYELLMKMSQFYVEKMETKTEHTGDVSIRTKEEAIAYVASKNG